MERLEMFVSNSGTIKHPNKYSNIYYVSTADLQAVIDGGVAIRISIAEVAGQVDADVAISQTTSTPDFQPNQEITMQSFTWWLSEGWVDIANDGSSVCVSQSSRSTRGQSCLAATALPLYLRVHCPATTSNDCQYSLKIEYACRKGWYIGPNKYCLACHAGKYSNTEEASSCKNCQYDKYSITGATSCDYTNTTCPPGTYSQVSNACVSCIAGKFQIQVGALSEAACVSCAPGKYSEKVKAFSSNDCIDCVQGKWASKTAADNRTVCQICSFGQYNLNSASTDCKFCPKGTYLADDKANEANHDQLNDCLTCPSGYYSEERSRYCTRCPAGKETGTVCIYSNKPKLTRTASNIF
jgi:hypothetical protein